MLLQRPRTEAGNRDDDLIGGLGPGERFRARVGGSDIVFDSVLEFSGAAMISTSKGLLGQLGEPTLNHVDPRGIGRREMQAEPRMLPKPAPHLGRAVNRRVVDDQLDVAILGYFLVDALQKAPELDGALSRVALPDDIARRDVQRSEQI